MLQALLTNIQAIARVGANKKKTINKEPYFDRKWGDNAAFKKTIDKTSYQLETQDHSAQIKEQILVMYKTQPAKSSGRDEFLSKLAGDSLEFIAEQRNKLIKEKVEEELCQNSMAAMTEHVFEILKAYSYELNNALGYGPLHVAATNPQTVTEVLKFDAARRPVECVTYYRARLSTPSFSLVLRGDKNGIKFFLLPVERALGLSKQEKQFRSLMGLVTRIVEGSVLWETECGTALTPSKLELLCMNLFSSLIETSKSAVESWESEEAKGGKQIAESEAV